MKNTGSCSNGNDDGGDFPNSLLRQEQHNLPSGGDAVKYDRINEDIGIPSDRTMANNYDSYFTSIKNHRFTSILSVICLVLVVTLLVVVLKKNDSTSCADSHGDIETQSTLQGSRYSMVIPSPDAVVGRSLASTSVTNSVPSTSDSSLLVKNVLSSTSYKVSSSPGQTESHESNVKEVETSTLPIPYTSDIKSSTTKTSDILTVSIISSTSITSTITNSTPSASTNSSPVQQEDIYQLFKEDIDHLGKTFSCMPRIVKLSILQAIDDSTNPVTDNALYPDVIAVMRCDHSNSFCCDALGKENSNKSCTSTKNKIKTHRAWYHKENKLVYENITIKEDLECKCI